MRKLELPPPPRNVESLTLKEAVDSFISAMSAVGVSVKTLKAYRSALKSFASYVGWETRVGDLGHSHYTRWLAHIQSGGLEKPKSADPEARRTTAHYYSVFTRRFLRWAGVSDRLPAVPRTKRGFSHALEWGEVRRLLEACRDLLDALIGSLLVETGIRVSEMLSLRPVDVDLEGGRLRVYGKYGKVRVVFLGPLSRALLAEYLQRVRVAAGRPIIGISYQAVYKRLKRLAERSGVGRSRVRPHVLRHTFATEALKRGMSLPSLQRLLGHSDVKITQLYLHLTSEDVRREYERVFYPARRQGGEPGLWDAPQYQYGEPIPAPRRYRQHERSLFADVW